MENILLVPIGSIEPEIQSAIASALRGAFRHAVEKGREILVPAEAYNKRRGQYLASVILDQLEERKPGRISRLLGVTEVDLYVPRLNFVFGLADAASGVGVISLARLREEFYGRRTERSVFLLRAGKEAVHEIGHTLGLGHCSNPRCVMFFSNSLGDTDRKESHLCTMCRSRLGVYNLP